MKIMSMVMCSVAIAFLFFPRLTFAALNKDVLKDLYDGAVLPASEKDFPKIEYGSGNYLEPSKNKCVRVEMDDNVYPFSISQVIRIIPSFGPLIPERKVEKLFFGNFSYSGFDQMDQATVIGKDLVVTNPLFETAATTTPAKILARESGEYIAFKMLIVGMPNNEYFGYCYPEGRSLF